MKILATTENRKSHRSHTRLQKKEKIPAHQPGSHIQEMLRCLDPSATIPMSDLEHSQQKVSALGHRYFSDSSLSRILTYDEVS